MSREEYSTQLVNPAVLTRAQLVDYAISHRSGSRREGYNVKIEKMKEYSSHTTSSQSTAPKKEPYGTLPVQQSTTPAYAAHQPPTSQVVVRNVTQKTDPHLGSNEFYSSMTPGVQILRRYNNLYIPQLPPY